MYKTDSFKINRGPTPTVNIMNTLLPVSLFVLLASLSSGKVFRASLLSMKENQIPQAEILLEQSSGTPDQAATEGTTDTASTTTSNLPASFIPGTVPAPVRSSNTGDTVLLQSGQSDEASQEAAEEGTQEAGQESTEEVTSESAEDATMDIPANAESYLADIEEMVTQIQKNVQSLQQMLGMSTDSSGTEQTSESG